MKNLCFSLVLIIVMIFSVGKAFSKEKLGDNELARVRVLVLNGKFNEAEKLLRSMSLKGNVEATICLGELLTNLGRYEDAIKFLEPLAKSGGPEIQWQLSVSYASVTPQNFEKAVYWMRRAAESGNENAKFALQNYSKIHVDEGGRVSKEKLLDFFYELAEVKFSNATDEVIACYGVGREDLISVSKKTVKICFDEIQSNDENSVLFDLKFRDELVSCNINKTLEFLGKSPSELFACLPNPGHDFKK